MSAHLQLGIGLVLPFCYYIFGHCKGDGAEGQLGRYTVCCNIHPEFAGLSAILHTHVSIMMNVYYCAKDHADGGACMSCTNTDVVNAGYSVWLLQGAAWLLQGDANPIEASATVSGSCCISAL